MPNRALCLQSVLQLFSRTGGQQQSQWPRRRVDHVYGVATDQQIVGEFAAYETGAYDQHSFGRHA